jgi:hypothetical protein
MAQSVEINPRLTENTCDEPDASLMPLEDYQGCPDGGVSGV